MVELALSNVSGVATELTIDSGFARVEYGFAVDSSGTTHVLSASGPIQYSSRCLTYIRIPAGGSSTVSRVFGSGCSADQMLPTAAVDRAGRLWVVYSEGGNLWLTVRSTTGTWSTPLALTNDGAGARNLDPCISIHASGRVAIVYARWTSLSREVMVITGDTAGMSSPTTLFTTSPSAPGISATPLWPSFCPSVACDARGVWHVSFTDVTATSPRRSIVRYTSNEGGQWQPAVQLGDTAFYNRTSIAVDRNGDPHIAVERTDDSTDWDIWYFVRHGGRWSQGEDVSQNDSLDIAAPGGRFIACHDSVVAITYTTTQWRGSHPSLPGPWYEIALAYNTIAPPPAPSFSLDTIDFGSVLVGACADSSVWLRALRKLYATDTMHVERVHAVGADAGAFHLSASYDGTTVLIDDSTLVDVGFCPTGPGCVSAKLAVVADGGIDTVVLRGCGVGPRIEVTPEYVDFGDVLTGACRDTSVWVHNRGGDSLVLGAARVSGTDSLAFTPSAATASIRLGLLDSTQVTIRFCPQHPGEHTGRITYTSNGSNGGEDYVLVRGNGIGPRLRMRPDTIDFGDVYTGRCVDTTEVVGNVGGDSLIIASSAVSGPQSRLFTVDGSVSTLRLGLLESDTVSVRYCATDSGQASARWIVSSNGSGDGRDTVVLLAHGVGPRLRVTPDTLEFGTIALGECSADSTFVIENLGGDSLRVDAPRAVGARSAAFVTTAPLQPVALGTLERFVSGRVRFCPRDTGCFSIPLVFESNGGRDTIILIGCALPPDPVFHPSDTIDFGLVRVGTCVDTTGSVANRGGGWLLGSPLTVVGGRAPWYFEVTAPTDSVVLAPGDSIDFALRYCPLDSGCIESRVEVQSAIGPRAVVLQGCAGAPGIAVEPTTVEFGEVEVDSCREGRFVVRNPGRFALRVTGLSLTPGTFAVTSPSVPFEVAADDSVAVTIRFCPQLSGETSEQLSIRSDGTADGRSTLVALHGVGIERHLRAPARLDFGDVPVGSCRDTLIVVGNDGSVAVTVQTIVAVDGSAVTVTWSGGARRLEPGDTVQVRVRFCPTSEETVSDAIEVRCSDAPTRVVQVRGRGIRGVLAASTVELDFGAVDVGTCARDSFSVRNVGTSSVGLNRSSVQMLAGVPTGTFRVIAPTALPQELAAGTTVRIVVEYCPTRVAADSADWSGGGDDGSTVEVGLRGRGVEHDVRVAPDTIGFTCVLPGERPAAAVEVHNDGSEPLVLEGYAISPVGDYQSPAASNVLIGPGETRVDSVRFAPTAASGWSSAELTVQTDQGDRHVALRGNASAVAEVVRDPDSVWFARVAVGDTAEVCVELMNPSCRPIEITRITSEDPSVSIIQPLTTPVVLVDSVAVEVCLRWVPTELGAMQSRLRLESASGAGWTVGLGGQAVEPGVVALTRRVDFGRVDLGDTVGPRAVGLTNRGSAPATVLAITLDGDTGSFVVPGTAPFALSPEGADTVWLDAWFAPVAVGARTAVLHIQNSSPSEPAVTLTGIGDTVGLELQPSAIDFGRVVVGTTRRASDTLRVRNVSTRAVTVVTLRLGGAEATTFGVDSSAARTLGPGEYYHTGLAFTPQTVGSHTARLEAVLDDGVHGWVDLQGDGIESEALQVRLDTVAAAAGEAFDVVARLDAALAGTDDIGSFTAEVAMDPRALYVESASSPMGPVTLRRLGPGRVRIDGVAEGTALLGDTLFVLQMRGLVTGQPQNVIAFATIELRDGASTLRGSEGHDGLVLLSGCDIGRGTGFGRLARLTRVEPNPATGSVRISWRAPEHAAPRVVISDMLGRTTRAIELPTGISQEQTMVVDVSDLASGLYTIELRTAEERESVPLLIVR